MLNKDWRMSNIYRIVDKRGVRVVLRENKIQSIVRKNKARRKRILKARQFGISTGCLIDILDRTLWRPNVTSVILAHEQDGIQKLFRIIQRAYKYLPDRLKPFVPALDRGGGSKYQMYFPEINSRIYCDLESRGDTINNLHISEAAFIPKPDRIKSTLEAVPMKGGRVTIETTANGMGNHFYGDWMETNSNFTNLFFPWFLHEEYKVEDHDVGEFTKEELDLIARVKAEWDIELTPEQIAFRRFKRNDLKDMFFQEYPEDDQSCFLSSGNTVIDLFAVKRAMEKAREPIWEDKDKGIKIFHPFNKTHVYVVGADTSEGFGKDYSSATVIDCTKRLQVASVHCKVKPSDFAHILNDLCQRFRNPLLGVERNNHGHAVLLELHEHIRYPNLYRGMDDRNGWVTDRVTRPIMVNALVDAVDNCTIEFNDRVFLNECLTFVNNDGKIEAASGKHDDMLMASAIALQLCVDAGTVDLYENIEDKILS